MSRVTDVVHNASTRCPGFHDYWELHHQRQADEAGHVTLHGAFCVLADYFDAHCDALSPHQQRDFWEWLHWQFDSADEELSNATATCFLESIAETDVEQQCREFMPAPIQDWIDRMAGRGRRKKRWFER